MSWDSTKNIVDMPNGNFRSILGYAGESLAIGRALVCGYNLFFKAWRDAKYDAVLDANGVLHRLEIKQTSGNSSLSTSSGGRTGQQIDRSAGSRERPLSTEDCDFILGTQSLNGKCWIIPVEIIELLGRKTLPFYFLQHFEEKWKIFMFENKYISNKYIISGFKNMNDDDLNRICGSLSIDVPKDPFIQLGKKTRVTVSSRIWKIVNIWLKIYQSI